MPILLAGTVVKKKQEEDARKKKKTEKKKRSLKWHVVDRKVANAIRRASADSWHVECKANSVDGLEAGWKSDAAIAKPSLP